VKRVIGRKKISRRIQCAAPGAPIQPAFRETIETVSPCAIPTLSPQIFSPARNDIFFGSFAALCIVYIDRFGSWLCKNAMLRKTHRMDFHQTAIDVGEILKRFRI